MEFAELSRSVSSFRLSLECRRRLSSFDLPHRQRTRPSSPRSLPLRPRPAPFPSPCRIQGRILRASMAFTENVLLHDLAMGLVTLSGAMATLKFWDELAKRNAFPMAVSRKLVHISVGLIFMLFWPLFSESGLAPYFAAFSAAINALRMLAIGFGIVQDAVAVKAMSRDGDYRELRKGPFYYATTITFATIHLWRMSPVAPIMIANLCAGDGFADLIGRRFGKVKLPFNSKKSFVGSFAMLFFGFVVSIGYHLYFSSFHFYTMSLELVLKTFIVALIATIVESLPISTELDDNLSVPLTSFVAGTLLI